MVEGVLVDQNGKGIAGVAVLLSGPAAGEVRTDRRAIRLSPPGHGRLPGHAQESAGNRPAAPGGAGGRGGGARRKPSGLCRAARIPAPHRGHPGTRSRLPLARREVISVPAIVTAVRAPAGFYVQSPLPDASQDTSEGLFVAAARLPDLAPGDLVLLDGRVEESTAAGAERSTSR